MGLIWLIASVIFFSDLLIKTYLRIHFSFTSTPVLKDIFHITVVFNTGAAFGIFKESTGFLISAGIIFILIFFFFLKSEWKENKLYKVSCGLILGGAFSNLYDRIFLGFVVDYLDFKIWPVFNLSDSCITVGVAFLIWHSFKKNKKNV